MAASDIAVFAFRPQGPKERAEKAREWLGMSADQHNLLIRVTLRSLDGSISKAEANRVYDLVYAELHEGTGGISAPSPL